MKNELIKVGNLVRIKDNIQAHEDLHDVGFTPNMLAHQGEVFQVKDVDNSTIYLSDGFWYGVEMLDKLYTVKEVITNIEDGDVFSNLQPRGLIGIYQEHGSLHFKTNLVDDEFNVPDMGMFIRMPKNRTIYRVEHSEGGRQYNFYSDDNLKLEEFVVCNTSMGLSYGKVVQILKDQPSDLGHKFCRRA